MEKPLTVDLPDGRLDDEPDLESLRDDPEIIDFYPPTERLKLYQRAMNIIAEEIGDDGVHEPALLLRSENPSLWLVVDVNPFHSPRLVGRKPFRNMDKYIIPNDDGGTVIILDNEERWQVVRESVPLLTDGIRKLRSAAIDDDEDELNRHLSSLTDSVVNIRSSLIEMGRAHEFSAVVRGA